MPEEKIKTENAAHPAKPATLRARATGWALRLWRPVGTAIAVVLALLLSWHVVYGKHGLNGWLQKRTEDHNLQQQIKDVKQDNAQMRRQIDRLKTSPDAIGQVARQKLHYVKPGEVIYKFSDEPQNTPPPQTGK